MKVLLANPPWLRPGWYGVRAGSRWPHMERADSSYAPFPFLMGYAAAVLLADGVEVGVVDACAERLDLPAFLRRVQQATPDLVVAETSTPSLRADLGTARALRDAGLDAPILLAGLHRDLERAAFLHEHSVVDGTLVGEYETALRDLVRAGGHMREPLPGLLWRDRGGDVIDGGRRPSLRDLDRLPWPARQLFPMDRYCDLPGGIPAPSVQMWASRGCSFGCSFCAWPQILYADRLYRTRSPDAVAAEMEAMLASGFSSVYFDDDTFNLGDRRTKALARAFSARGIDAPWAFMGRADTCDPRLYEQLAASGLAAVKFGVESADGASLRRMGKDLDVDRVREAVRAVRSLGIRVHLTFVFGLPGETADSMRRTADLAWELAPDSAQFSVAVPFPGSRLHEELVVAGHLADFDPEDLDGYRAGVVRTDDLEAAQIVSFVHDVQRRWEGRTRTAGEAPAISVAGAADPQVCVGLLARPGEDLWLRRALLSLAADPCAGVVVAADRSDPGLRDVAASALPRATVLDAEPSASRASMSNLVASTCSAPWLALLAEGVLPRPGFAAAAAAAVAADPQCGALALPLLRPGRDPAPAALSMSRWGRVLPSGARPGDPVFAVSGKAGLFRREMLEDALGFDPLLPDELADVDLALRGILLGYRFASTPDPEMDAPADIALIAEDAKVPLSPAAQEVWAAARIRLLLKSVPRTAWAHAAPAVALDLVADVYRAARHGRRAVAVARGFLRGLRERSSSLSDRRRTLGRRRTGDRFVGHAFAAAEADMSHCRWQRILQALLAGWPAPVRPADPPEGGEVATR